MNDIEKINILTKENKELKNKLKLLLEQEQIKDDIVIQQSKMASMGEMISNIAHQWRQPLMEVSSLMMNMEAKIKLIGNISDDDIIDTTTKTSYIVKFMSDTIDDFRNFFTVEKKKEDFLITEQISLVLNIMKSSLTQNNIKVNVIIKNNIKIYGLRNEYSQVLMNIISNAIDVFIDRQVVGCIITIKVYISNNDTILEIEDNAGGIEVVPISKVFDPFFTYQKKNGTGIGLFMSKLIIENNMTGLLTVNNTKNGASFKIVLPNNKNKIG